MFYTTDLHLLQEGVLLQVLPAGQQLQGWSAQQFVREEVDLLHDVGQPDGKLLSEEDERGLLTGVGRPCSHMRCGVCVGGGGERNMHKQALNFDLHSGCATVKWSGLKAANSAFLGHISQEAEQRTVVLFLFTKIIQESVRNHLASRIFIDVVRI